MYHIYFKAYEVGTTHLVDDIEHTGSVEYMMHFLYELLCDETVREIYISDDSGQIFQYRRA